MTISSFARGAGSMRLHLQAQRSLASTSSSASSSSSLTHSLKRQITRPRLAPAYSPIASTSSILGRDFSSTCRRGFQSSRSSAALFDGVWGSKQEPAPVSESSPTTGSLATEASQNSALSNEATSSAATTAPVEPVSTSVAGQETPIIDGIVSLDPTTSANALETVVTATHAFSEIPHSWFPNVRVLEYLMNTTADVTHLPWWAVIVGVTLTARLALLPLAISGHARSIRMANIQPQMKNVMETMKAAKANGDQLMASEATLKVQQLFKKYDCHPGKMVILPLVQGGFFMSFFFAIRRLAEEGLVGLNEGVGYLPSLLLPDTTWILPVTAAATSLILFETGAEMGAATSANNQSKAMRYVFRGLLPLMVFWTYSLPSAVFFFWLTNNAYSLVQMLALNRPSVQNYLGFPKRIQHPKTEEPTKKDSGGFKGFVQNIRDGYEAERKRVLTNSGDNYASSSARSAQSSSTERQKAYQKWLKPAQAAVTPSAPSSDLFESGSASKAGAEETGNVPKANAQTSQDAARNARIHASRQRRAQRKRH